MATNQNVKDFLTFSGDCFGIGPKMVNGAALLRIKAWFEAKYASSLDGAEMTANDFSALVWSDYAPLIKAWEREQNIAAANVEPAELDDTP